MKQIQIPWGMRDTLPNECRKKESLRKRIEAVYESYGYQPVETPLIEYWSTYRNAFENLQEETLYKMTSEDGKIAALRTDMTMPIARLCGAKLSSSKEPLRLRYCANVYKVRQTFAGKRSEVTDCGVELIGAGNGADLEVLACAMDVMESFGIENYTLEIGNSRFFDSAAENLKEEDRTVIASLIDRKSMVELEEYLSGMELSEEEKNLFLELPLLSGKDALERAEQLSFREEMKEVIGELRQLEKELGQLGYGNAVVFDLGKIPHLDYYTGIIFEGYVEGVGTGVLSGGRYDNLLARFGKDMPAIGFGVKLDYLLDVIEEEEFSPVKIYYTEENRVEALKTAAEMRNEMPVELILSDRDEVEVE